jgi:hypothetical protein
MTGTAVTRVRLRTAAPGWIVRRGALTGCLEEATGITLRDDVDRQVDAMIRPATLTMVSVFALSGNYRLSVLSFDPEKGVRQENL